MFKHLFIYRLKVLSRNKTMIFWTMIFPIALSTFFYMALGGLSDLGTFNPIDVAVVTQEANPDFMEVIESMSTGEERMFNLQTVSQESAQALLSEGQIAGFITLEDTPTLSVNRSGISQSILKTFLDRYMQTTKAIGRIAMENPSALSTLEISTVEFTEEAPISTSKMNVVLNYYYALIAMACFYGSFFGLEEVSYIQANLTHKAARINVAPVHKLKAFVYSSMASYMILITEMMILMAYLVFVLGVDFGDRIGFVLFTILIGSLAGMTFGSFVAALVKKDENVMSGILIGVTMLGSLLAGMMFDSMKYVVQTTMPILQYINPVNLISDAFYALYYFDSMNRYLINISGLVIFAVIFSLSTYLVIRRRRYASI